MTSISDPSTIVGRTVVDRSGNKVGKAGQVYLDDRTGQPVWVTVKTGMFGNKDSFAPLSGATTKGDDVALAVDKDKVKDAPKIDDDGHLDDGQQDALYDYYADSLGGQSQPAGSQNAADPSLNVGGGTTGGTGGTSGGTGGTTGGMDGGTVGGPGHDTSGPNTDDAMTRSEERVNVGTEQVTAGRAKLRKYVVTENVTQTVPVSHEEVRIEREPITDANVGAATDGPAISEEEHEVTLHAERPVVEKEAVPVERVRMGTETVTDQETVNENVRKEQIDVDNPTTAR
jgi:uncharacterized protein (TIGR02271 family)